MKAQPVIIVQVAGRGWTLIALHAACQMVKRQEGRILLVKMVPVQHVAWLGTDLGYMDFTYEEQTELDEYHELIEEYEIEFAVYVFQYVSLVNAIAQVVEQAEAQVAFVTLPTSSVPGWRKFQLYRLRQSLARRQCDLVETPHFDTGDYTSSEWQKDEERVMEEMPLVFNPFEL